MPGPFIAPCAPCLTAAAAKPAPRRCPHTARSAARPGLAPARHPQPASSGQAARQACRPTAMAVGRHMALLPHAGDSAAPPRHCAACAATQACQACRAAGAFFHPGPDAHRPASPARQSLVPQAQAAPAVQMRSHKICGHTRPPCAATTGKRRPPHPAGMPLPLRTPPCRQNGPTTPQKPCKAQAACPGFAPPRPGEESRSADHRWGRFCPQPHIAQTLAMHHRSPRPHCLRHAKASGRDCGRPLAPPQGGGNGLQKNRHAQSPAWRAHTKPGPAKVKPAQPAKAHGRPQGAVQPTLCAAGHAKGTAASAP